MNRIYRVAFNRALRTMQVASELAHARTCRGSGGIVAPSAGPRRPLAVACAFALLATTFAGAPAHAQSHNVDVVAGSGTTNINGTTPFVPTGNNAKLGVDLLTGALGSGSVTVNTGTIGTQDGNITLSTMLDYNGIGNGNKSLTFNASNNIILNGDIRDSAPGGDSLDLTLFAGGGVTFDNPMALNGDLSVTTNGDITQATGIAVTGTTSIDAGAHAIILNSASNDFIGAANMSNAGAHDVTLNNGSNALTLGTVDIGGTLSLAYDHTLTLDGNVTLHGPLNPLSFATPVLLGNNVTLTTTDSNVIFAGTVDNAASGTSQALTVAAGTGAV